MQTTNSFELKPRPYYGASDFNQMPRMDTRHMTVYELVKRVEAKTIIGTVSNKPAWDDAKASRFIESLRLLLPMPTMVMAEDKGGWQIVDGNCRVDALVRFIKGGMALTGVSYLSIDLEGTTWKYLPRSEQRKIEDYTQLPIYLIRYDDPNKDFLWDRYFGANT